MALMPTAPAICLAAVGIVLLNLPFGYWRAGQRRLSLAWFLAVHLPVPVAIGLRWALGLPFQPGTLPFYVVAFFTGQLLGGRLRAALSGGRR
jgi:hypothetical protein